MYFGVALTGVICAIVIATQCKSSTNPPPPPPTLELLYPKGGQSFKVGDTVLIKWSIHDTNQVKSVGISYSLDNGRTFPGTQIIPSDTGSHGSTTYPDVDCRWIIGARDTSNQFILCIWEYGGQCLSCSATCSSPCDKSAPFVVHQ